MKNEENLNNSQSKRQATDTNPKVTKMLELWYKDFQSSHDNHALRPKDQHSSYKWKDGSSQHGNIRYKLNKMEILNWKTQKTKFKVQLMHPTAE